MFRWMLICLILLMYPAFAAHDFNAVKKAAEQGNPDAQYILGLMYAEGKKVPENDAKAVHWLRKAAEQGNSSAQLSLGVIYAEGERVPEDDAEAVHWFRKAAEQGNSSAQYILGWMYAEGEGVPEDDVQAYAWINIAAAQGEELAKKAKGLISKDMTRAEIARAQELSDIYWQIYVFARKSE